MLHTEQPGRVWRSPRHWSLRVKLAIVLLVPGLLAGTLGGLRIADDAGEARQLGRVTELVAAEDRFSDVVEAVAQERYDSAVYVAGGRRDDADVRTAVAAADAAAADARGVLDEVVADDPALLVAAGQARQALARLGDVRNLVMTSAAPPSAVVTRYSDLLTPLVELDRALLRGVDVDAVDGLSAALSGLAAARNELTLQFALVAAGDVAPAELLSSEGRLRTALSDFRSALDAGQRVRYATLIAGPGNTARAQLVQAVLADQDGRDPEAVYGAVLAELSGAQTGVRSELTAVSTRLRDAAGTAAVVSAVLLLLALAVAAVVVGLIARAMIVALRRLRLGALEVAQRRLPEAVERMRTVEGVEPTLVVEPIGIDTREEIGEVARAFDAVHGEAVRLAAQQSLLRNNINDIFVNLSQRSQGLVKRQLALIDGLERTEQDPDHLENLFQLDHLATRMRRNNENLLVLAGAADLRARRKRPVPARDVLRAAVSEIEQYRRVVVRRAPGVAVAGPVVNDLVHLVAELLDNATSFSPPDSEVVLRAATGAGGTLVVEIVDTGVGIPPAELAALNTQLAAPPVVDLAVARRMGLFVVGRLARRHNITVVLRPAPEGSGVHATVEVPAVYLQSGATPGADGDLDVPTQVLPVTTARTRSELPAPPAPPAPRTSPEAQPAFAAVPPSTPRRDGPVPADDPLSGPWLPAPVEADERELPIYGEMRSAWFRQRRFASALGNDWTPQGPGSARVPGRSGLPPTGAGPDGAAPEAPVPTAPVPRGSSVRPLPVQRPGAAAPEGSDPAEASALERDADPIAPSAQPAAQSAVVRPATTDHAPDATHPAPAAAAAADVAPDAVEWGEVDAGWAAARSAADPRPDTTTSAGLPKRKPKSQLVPGSITPGAGPAAVRPPTRSPEVVRGRLSGYQRGLREGREARAAEIARRAAADGQGG